MLFWKWIYFKIYFSRFFKVAGKYWCRTNFLYEQSYTASSDNDEGTAFRYFSENNSPGLYLGYTISYFFLPYV